MKKKNRNLFLIILLVGITALGVVGDVEGVEFDGVFGVIACLDDESISFATNDGDLGDQETIHVPGDAPANSTYK